MIVCKYRWEEKWLVPMHIQEDRKSNSVKETLSTHGTFEICSGKSWIEKATRFNWSKWINGEALVC